MPAVLIPRAAELFTRELVKGSPEYVAENNAPAILTIVGIVGGLSFVAVALRVYVRQFMLKGVTADDTVMAVAMVCILSLGEDDARLTVAAHGHCTLWLLLRTSQPRTWSTRRSDHYG